MARSMKEVHTINYYPINEGAARRAKEMNSFSDYKEGDLVKSIGLPKECLCTYCWDGQE